MWFIIIKFLLTLFCALVFLLITLIIVARFSIEPFRKGKCKCKTSLLGKVVLVTGGNSGIGLETARNLAERGAQVIIASRNDNKSEEAVKSIKESTGNNNVEFKHLDLSKLKEVRQFAKEFNDSYARLDILVLNAGIGPRKYRLTVDGMNLVIQVNYVAQFLLTHLLLNKLIKTKPSRIVIVSSYLHKHANLNSNDIGGVNLSSFWSGYCNSKFCQVLWAKALAKKLPNDVIVNTLHPGAVKTNIFHQLEDKYRKILFLIFDLLLKTAEEGAQTVIHLCVSPNVVESGNYYVDCYEYPPAKEALDNELIEKVWNETMKLVME